MKIKILAAVAALAMASGTATGAGSADYSLQTSTRAMDLTECQVQHLARCMVVWGDYVSCYQQAQDYAC